MNQNENLFIDHFDLENGDALPFGAKYWILIENNEEMTVIKPYSKFYETNELVVRPFYKHISKILTNE